LSYETQGGGSGRDMPFNVCSNTTQFNYVLEEGKSLGFTPQAPQQSGPFL